MFFRSLVVAFCGYRTKSSLVAFAKMSSSTVDLNLSYINSTTAAGIDEMLMTQPGFSLDQLMELAGLAVAQSAHSFATKHRGLDLSTQRNVLILAGPGNNGGDGLVAARHLYHFGYLPSICYPKMGKTPLFANLVKQCQDLDIPFLDVDTVLQSGLQSYSLVVDSLFGFSFKGPPAEPYRSLIAAMAASPAPVLSVDVPSGWHVEDGDTFSTGFTPAAVISLTLPKLCMSGYQGVHYVGGR